MRICRASVRFLPTTLGTLSGAGPLLRMTCTRSLGLSSVPTGGSTAMTMPLGRLSLYRSAPFVTVNLACCSSSCASANCLPTTSGTW